MQLSLRPAGSDWPDEFCTRLAEHGYFVIRYDHRDTGQSSSVDFTARPYDLNDLTRDAVAVLDGYGIGRAHIVGVSMGGFIGQLLTLDYPDRVLTLTLIMTSADHRVTIAAMSGLDSVGFRLAPPSSAMLEHFARMRETPARTGDEAIQNAVESWRIANGVGVPFDEDWTRRLVTKTWARAKSPLSAVNHTFAMARSPGRTERLGQIAIPTLVIHGQHDPLLPLDHGKALAESIPGARLAVIPDMGHMLPPRLSGRIAGFVLEHLDEKGK